MTKKPNKEKAYIVSNRKDDGLVNQNTNNLSEAGTNKENKPKLTKEALFEAFDELKKLKESAKRLNEKERNKLKLFEDYEKDTVGNDEITLLWDFEEYAMKHMLDDLAQKNFDLEKDNDLLRGQITELTHKMDFVMENARSSEHYHLTDDLIKQGFSSLPMTLSDHYELTKGPSLMERMKEEGEKLEKSLKKKKKGVK